MDLKERTDKLPDLEKLVGSKGHNLISYDVEEGQCSGAGLWKTNKIAVQLCTLSDGTIFPMHHHDNPVEVEWLHIITGMIKVIYEDGIEEIVGERESISFKDEVNHKVIALSYVELLGVTLPADKSYPDGR